MIVAPLSIGRSIVADSRDHAARWCGWQIW